MQIKVEQTTVSKFDILNANDEVIGECHNFATARSLAIGEIGERVRDNSTGRIYSV